MPNKKMGRPRSRPPDLVSFTAQMSAGAKVRLKALAQLEGAHAYAVMEKALWAYFRDLPKSKRDALEVIASTLEESRESGR